MNVNFTKWLMPLSVIIFALTVFAGDTKLEQKLKTLRPDIPIESVQPSPVPGILELKIKGGGFLYGTEDGRFLFAGDLFELGETELINLADAKRDVLRKKLLAAVELDDMLVFPAKIKTRGVISVFTDIDCGYCRKLHLEVPELNASGIEVRYLAYPRAGVGSESYMKFVSAWCSEDKNDAITRSKLGQVIPEATCDNPVAKQFALGRELGVTGTPAIVLENGRLLPGYMKAKDLIEAMGFKKSDKS